MNHWRNDPRGVFELARRAHAPPRGAKERSRKKLDTKLAALTATVVGVSSAKAALLGLTTAVGKGPLLALFFIGAATAGYAGGKVIAHHRETRASIPSWSAAAPAVGPSTSATSAAPAANSVALVVPDAPAASIAPVPSVSAEARRASDVNRAFASVPEPPSTAAVVLESPTRLAEEAELIRLANQALGSGNGPQALTILDRHAREFPTGALTEERVAAQIMAACQLGRGALARGQFDAFIEHWPRSPHRTRVRSACGWQ